MSSYSVGLFIRNKILEKRLARLEPLVPKQPVRYIHPTCEHGDEPGKCDQCYIIWEQGQDKNV